MTIESLKAKIRTVPNWPKPGIMFRDITTLVGHSEGFTSLMEHLTRRYEKMHIDAVAGIESRGFITGSALANKLGVGFIPIRKRGKLPAETVSQEYQLEYGTDHIEIHLDAVKAGQKILVVDDLIATGGTALAACQLIEKVGGVIVECSFIIDLPDLGGKRKLEKHGYKAHHVMEFEGD